MYSIGFDVGSSSVKVALLEIESGKVIAQTTYPDTELKIDSPHFGWAEQQPETWWECVCNASKILLRKSSVPKERIASIGISYQMHGLVIIDKNKNVLRPSIIWCDSRAVSIGDEAQTELGAPYCSSSLLNSPGNFTASKLKWVKDNEVDVYGNIFKFMLPGDYIAMKMTGEINTTISGLSEGIFWDYKKNKVSTELMNYFGFHPSLIPDIVPTFAVHGKLIESAAEELGLKAGTVISYRAGDQPNNALSLGVMNPGDAATTAGTSGVIYGITDTVQSDSQSRVNLFAHVNHTFETPKLGILLCINGTGILNSWMRKNITSDVSYKVMNQIASRSPIGADGVIVLPFGNGAERIFNNKIIGSHFIGIDFNRHSQKQLLRAAQEGIVFALRYGFDIMKSMNFSPKVIKAGNGNMFLSEIFAQTFVNSTGAHLGLYDTDGACGAARGAAFGAGFYSTSNDMFIGLQPLREYEPDPNQLEQTEEAYQNWLQKLEKFQNN